MNKDKIISLLVQEKYELVEILERVQEKLQYLYDNEYVSLVKALPDGKFYKYIVESIDLLDSNGVIVMEE